MKKTLFVVAAVALLPFVACQKETLIPQNSAEEIEEIHAPPVFTAVIGNTGTKTVYSAGYGKVSWEETDSITVKDAAGASAVYKVSKIDLATGKAEFKIREGETPLGEGPYRATYGTEPSKNQIWKAPDMTGEMPIFPVQPYMEALGTDNSFTFEVKCGIIVIRLQSKGDSLTSVSVTRAPTDSTEEEVYTLYCEEPQSADDMWLGAFVVPAGSYNKFAFTNSNGLVHMKYNYFDYLEPTLINPNQALIVSHYPYEDGTRIPFYLLPSEFSVGENARVMFAAGNDYFCYDEDGYYLQDLWEDNQYDIEPTSEYDNSRVGLFYWRSDKKADEQYPADYGGSAFFASGPANSDNYVSYYVDDGTAHSTRNFALSKEQWEYLLNLDGKESGRQGNRFAKAKFNNVNGLLVFPDGYDGVDSGDGFSAPLNDKNVYFPESNISEENWASLLADGVLFLPVAGIRWYDSDGSKVEFDSDAAQYWTSSLEDDSKTSDDDNAYYLDFGGNDIKFVAGSRKEGRAVRLAKPANAFFMASDD